MTKISEACNDLGEFLYAAREKKSYTLAQVAAALDLKSPQAIWDWENDDFASGRYLGNLAR